jgi:hypothetical protein
MTCLVLELGHDDPIHLRFTVRENPIAHAWLERMSQRDSWPLDDPARFYGFNSQEKEQQQAERQILQCVNIINDYEPIIDRPFTSVQDQDYLNYLHHIFEIYHGLLDQQHHEFWARAPHSVRVALAELNIAVHRCESLSSVQPRLVCTWFGMPKTHQLDLTAAAQYGSMQVPFGTVCLNYVEIGKTLEDLAHDQDQYIGDHAFQPWQRYSADFFVPFFDVDRSEKLPHMEKYLQQHRDFFVAQGIESVYNVKALPMRFPVADLEDSRSQAELIQQIAQRQYIKRVSIQ